MPPDRDEPQRRRFNPRLRKEVTEPSELGKPIRTSFNPRPDEATGGSVGFRSPSPCFNPRLLAEATVRRRRAPPSRSRFNPRPLGEAAAAPRVRFHRLRVSIHAHEAINKPFPERIHARVSIRAPMRKRRQLERCRKLSWRFQSTPREETTCGRASVAVAFARVSIHAPQGGESIALKTKSRAALFQSTSQRRWLRYLSAKPSVTTDTFQSNATDCRRSSAVINPFQ
jgi:hypothetical protein